jgi:hypothetical protein
LTSNDPTSIIENTTFHELGLYCSNHCRNIIEKLLMYCSYYSNTRGVTPIFTDFELNRRFISILNSLKTDYLGRL